MSNKDLTVVFLTNDEVPESWKKYHAKVLLEAIGDAELITVSRKPSELPGINIIQTEPKSFHNIYFQMLKAFKLAKTPYVAIAEDDTLYCKEHYQYRPPMDVFAYNMSRWSIFTWDPSMYSWRDRLCNKTLICSRELAIEALEERFRKHPEGLSNKIVGEFGRGMVERNMDVTERKAIEFYTPTAVEGIDHDFSTDEKTRLHRKRLGMIRAYEVPYWGRADKLIQNFK